MTREVLEQLKKYCEGKSNTEKVEISVINLNRIINVLERDQCGDCISREAVLKAIDAKAWEFCDYLISNGRNDEQKPVSHFADNLRECVGDLPPVTPAPKIGHWIKCIDDNGSSYYLCSVCRCGEDFNFDFCPNCGSENREVEECPEKKQLRN